MEPIVEAWKLPVEPSLRTEDWMKGELAEEWTAKFKDELPLFFDTAGDWFVEHQGKPFGYGFYETLAGIVLYQATGYLPLSSSYDFRFSVSAEQIAEGKRVLADEKKKLAIVEALFSEKELDVIREHKDGRLTQPPDLLMYAPDRSDWFFCEVKGNGDRLSDGQVRKFTEIAQVTRKPIRVLRFERLS